MSRDDLSMLDLLIIVRLIYSSEVLENMSLSFVYVTYVVKNIFFKEIIKEIKVLG